MYILYCRLCIGALDCVAQAARAYTQTGGKCACRTTEGSWATRQVRNIHLFIIYVCHFYPYVLIRHACHLYVHTIYALYTLCHIHALYIQQYSCIYSYNIHALYSTILINRVHFDGYSSNWSEWYSERDLQAGKIVPIYTHTKPRLEISALRIQHRRKVVPPPPPPTTTTTATTSNNNIHSNSNSMYIQYELVGVPYLIHCESTRSCKHAYSHIVDQALRYATAGESSRIHLY